MLQFIFGLFVGSWLLGSKETKEKQEVSSEVASFVMFIVGVPIFFLALYLLLNLPDLLGVTSSFSLAEGESSKHPGFGLALSRIVALWPYFVLALITIPFIQYLFLKKHE